MNQEELFYQIKKKKSFLCVGLDTDENRIPVSLKGLDDPIFEFNKQIIDATNDLCVAYKPNVAFYESLGFKGWQSLEKTVEYLKKNYPEQFIIADAKRGDIGNSSSLYARAFFEQLKVDAVTIAPYMGEDSVKPFLSYPGTWGIILALTSNKGAADFQYLKDGESGDAFFEKVLKTSQKWGTTENIMYVVGATKAEKLKEIRKIVPDHFLLVPGVGAQGGSLEEVAKYGMNKKCGLLVNSSRGIIYASSEKDFADKAHDAALKIQVKMEEYLGKAGI
ncbi:MAG: orotidine-5'-phosphate decarboxylase [Prolixibacteraceae bacterium]|nr:orotidine-5'-phosphate decarboxylase [Prolixibacteraceae bacterium]